MALTIPPPARQWGLVHDEAGGLGRLNALPADDAEAALRGCCASRRWAALVAAGRPYATAGALLDAAEQVWSALDDTDWLQAFAAHPRIGDLAAAGRDPNAHREQAAAAGGPADTAAALAEGNRRYEERFGHVFLVFASGRGAGELLEVLRARLANTPAHELVVAAGEQARISRLRLERLLAERD
jgi:2-oxo-4-hydroxy-4-carboxy-5-ureidoimidazoline decarboxylase